jgi:hypothetical protein
MLGYYVSIDSLTLVWVCIVAQNLKMGFLYRLSLHLVKKNDLIILQN